MQKKCQFLVATGAAVAALLLSGCGVGTATNTDDPNWQVSLSQSSEVSPENKALLEDAEPQFNSARYSATFVPLGERVDTAQNKKIVTFAVSANLPANCLERNGEDMAPADGSGACVDFTYGASSERVEQEGKDYKSPLHTSIETAFLENRTGSSVLEISAPVDAKNFVVNIVADGESLMIDPVSGEKLNDRDGKAEAPAPTEEAAK